MMTRQIEDAALDLTLREAKEAKGYKLSAEDYAELKNQFLVRFRQQYHDELWEDAKTEAKDELRAEIAKEVSKGLSDALRPRLKEEMLPELRTQIETELSQKNRAEVRKELAEEFLAQVPTDRQRAAFREYVREAELDCLTQAHASALDGERVAADLKWSRNTRLPFAYALFLALPILAFVLYQHYLTSAGFWAFLVPAVIAAIAFAGHLSDRHTRLSSLVRSHERATSEYRVSADEAKRLRIVTADSASTRAELRDGLNSFLNGKRNLDKEHRPNIVALEKARIDIRNQLMSEVDPDKILRIENTEAIEDFDDKLAQRAQAS